MSFTLGELDSVKANALAIRNYFITNNISLEEARLLVQLLHLARGDSLLLTKVGTDAQNLLNFLTTQTLTLTDLLKAWGFLNRLQINPTA